MPTIHPGDKVLVSGANGYIAAHVVRTLLEHGYSVRGTVRSEDKGTYLKNLFDKEYPGKFEIVVVNDIIKEGAFDEAVKNVDAIAHLATPVVMPKDGSDPQEMISPAVNGTIGILNSTLKHGTKVKKVVVTASTGSVLHNIATPRTFDENDWNDPAVEAVGKTGANASGIDKYWASKVLAERAAWDLYRSNSVSWGLTVLNPPYVFGPIIHEITSRSSLNASMRLLYSALIPDGSPVQMGSLSTDAGICHIDVRDLALAHVLALEKEESTGQRLIISAPPSHWQHWYDAVHSMSPLPDLPLAKGTPGAGDNVTYVRVYDASKGKRILGIEYRSLVETAQDSVKDFVARGW